MTGIVLGLTRLLAGRGVPPVLTGIMVQAAKISSQVGFNKFGEKSRQVLTLLQFKSAIARFEPVLACAARSRRNRGTPGFARQSQSKYRQFPIQLYQNEVPIFNLSFRVYFVQPGRRQQTGRPRVQSGVMSLAGRPPAFQPVFRGCAGGSGSTPFSGQHRS